MYQALYRKYRPKNFEDVCGQDHITSVLRSQLQNGRVSHAYIFCGSRGTGKTTCAKILAKAVNCENPVDGEPCNTCPSCLSIQEDRVLDVVEMDAASNNGVDHIRRLCDEVQFLPSQAKKRVYIIDEVHMLSTSAFNALLKTIEEPPSHVLFILATTESNDIPATIMSRCQRFDFRRISAQIVSDRLMFIADKEKIPLTKEASDVLARLSDGAMRDALSLLEACRSMQGEITAERVREILGLGGRDSVISLCRAISEKNAEECLRLVHQVYDRLSDFKDVVSQLIAIYRDLLVIRSISDYRSYVECYENELEDLESIAFNLTVEEIILHADLLERFYIDYDRIATEKRAASEIMMIKLCRAEICDDQKALAARISRLEKQLETGVVIAEKGFPSDPSRKDEKVKPPKTAHSPKPSRQIDREEASKKDDSLFSDSTRLKSLLQGEAFLKPWVSGLKFSKNGNTLHVICGAFTKGILENSNAQASILTHAKEIDSGISAVIFDVEEPNSIKQTSTEFDGL